MSAIYGIISKNRTCVATETAIHLRASLAHRATDMERSWDGAGATLGSCKLLGNPKQKNDDQPAISGDLVIVADSRLDNREKLLNLMGLDVRKWSLRLDVDLILEAYRKWEKHCPKYLEGEFVFAIWNTVDQSLFIASDPVGFRPVYYYNGPDRFVFCSEIKGVVAAMEKTPVFDEMHLVNYHFSNLDPATTYVKEVFALCGAKTLYLDRVELRISRYWTLEAAGRYRFTTDDEWFTCMRDLLFKAVEKRMSPAGVTGVTLSGGLDSGTVTGILAQVLAKRNKPLYAFSSVLPEDHQGIERDERKFIGLMNKMYPNIIQTNVEALGVGPLSDVGKSFELDESIPNAFFYMDHALLEAASMKGVDTLFSGFGGDMLTSWRGTPISFLLGCGAVRDALRLVRQTAVYDETNWLQTVRTEYLVHTGLWKVLRRVLARSYNTSWQSHLKADLTDKYAFKSIASSVTGPGSVLSERIANGHISRLVGTFANRNARYNMVPCEPLLDKDLLEFLIEVPAALFNAAGQRRGLLRQAITGLVPQETQWRKDKLPFSPDFVSRLLSDQGNIRDILYTADHAFLFDTYFSKESIEDTLPYLMPFAGFKSKTSYKSIRTLQALIACRALIHLKDRGYTFI